MIKRIYPDTPIGRNGETLFEIVKKTPSFLEYLLKEHHRVCIYKEDIWRMQDNIPKIRLSEHANYNQSVKESIHKSGSSCTIKELKIKKELPFVPDDSQVIYVEGKYEQSLNYFIQKNINTISSCLKNKDKSFIYIPDSIKDIQNNYSYYYPYKTTYDNDITPNSIISKLFEYSIDNIEIQAGLLRYKGIVDGYYSFSYYIFDKRYDTDFLKYFEWYNLALENSYHVCPSPVYPYIDPDDNADYDFDYESKKLIDEIKERVEILKQKGINEMILKSILSIDSVKLSRLVITNEYKIFLSDFNNLEIAMYPLPKAVFFLFLNHPEGILFKNLPDYRDELIAIYKKVSGRENIEDMEKSINDVVNPTLNSINEKCSRIREAFIKHFDEAIAKNYFITGNRATPKKISIDRSLVILEEVEIKVEVVKTPFEYTKYKNRNNISPFDDDLPF